MAEVRQDAVSGRWVIIATERAARPHDFHVGRGGPRGGFCPFCEGNEDRTPPEIAAVRPAGGRPNGPGWQVRVVPNKFPALQPGAEGYDRGGSIHRVVGGHGAHEVIIESPEHLLSPVQLSPERFALVMRTCRDRYRALIEDERISYVLVFKNVGERAGASIEHTHSQLIAVPVMPKRVAEEMRRCEAFYRDESECLFCSMLAEELDVGERIVADCEGYVVLSPYAARFPFELWVLPKEHHWHFHELDAAQIGALARVLHEVLARLEACLREPPFNYLIHTAPVSDGEAEHYHWHIEVIPRVTHVAGFEWGTGFYINPMEPEAAARHLREVSDEELRNRNAAALAVETTSVESLAGKEQL